MKIKSIEIFKKYQQEKLGKKGLSNDQLIQATSEIFLTAHFCDIEIKTGMGLSIDTDVKVNPPSRKDVDIQLCKNDLTLNIEVKTPNQDTIEEGKFYGGLPHRYPGVERAENNPDVRKISEMLEKQSGIETQILKTNDNRLKDFIDGANEKFSERCSNSLNILAVMCTSAQMGEILLYLMNPDSGLITTTSYEFLDFSKIDYILLSNAVEGIVNQTKYTFDANVFSNYVTLVFSPHKERASEKEITKLLFSLIPNENNKFCNFEKEYPKELRKGKISDDMHYQFTWSGYLAKYHPEFALNKPIENYI